MATFDETKLDKECHCKSWEALSGQEVMVLYTLSGVLPMGSSMQSHKLMAWHNVQLNTKLSRIVLESEAVAALRYL